MTDEKEQEIKEMETDVEWCLYGSAYGEKANVDADSLAYLLRTKGYRKADYVRKETAEEILQRIYNLFIFAEESEQKVVIDATYICNFAEKEYGVEVEG